LLSLEEGVMTVAELITALQKLPAKAPVALPNVLCGSHFEDAQGVKLEIAGRNGQVWQVFRSPQMVQRNDTKVVVIH
jgi:hypothetical protein